MSSGGKNQNDAAARQARANARSARRQGYNVLDKGAQQLEDYTSQLESAAGQAVSSMGQSGMFAYGGPEGRQAGQMRDANDFGISMADTDADSIAGFDRDRYNEIKDELDNLAPDLPDKADYVDENGDFDEQAWRAAYNAARSDYLTRKNKLKKKKKRFRDERKRANRIRSGWEDALDDVGDTELDLPGQMSMAQGSNLLNLSRMRAGMQRDVSKIQNAAMTAADSAFFDSQQQIDNANYFEDLADEQRRAERTQSWIRGITGGALLATGTILTGGAALGASGAFFSGATAAGSMGLAGSGASQLGSSFI